MADALEVRSFDAASPPPAEVVARLHAQLLPTSPVALLGSRFMRDFYYRLLPAHGLSGVSLAYVNGQPAAFVAYTGDPAGFMGAAIRRWWYRLAWVLLVSIIEKPSRLAALWEAFRIMSTRSDEPSANAGAGEILSLGVLPEYTDPGYVQRTGLRIARDLIAESTRQLAAAGSRSVIAIVDSDNRAAQMMYHGLGWRLTRNSVPGWRVPTVEFTWTAPTEK